MAINEWNRESQSEFCFEVLKQGDGKVGDVEKEYGDKGKSKLKKTFSSSNRHWLKDARKRINKKEKIKHVKRFPAFGFWLFLRIRDYS